MAENSLEIRTKIRMAQWHSIMCRSGMWEVVEVAL